MGFVVQILNRSGRVEVNHRIDRPTATVGRAFDSDVLLNDPFVDARHIVIKNGLDGLQIDVISEEGLSTVNGSAVEPSVIPLASGSELTIGRTHLRIVSTAHPVEPVRSADKSELLLEACSQPRVLVGLTAVFLFACGIDAHLNNYDEWEFSPWLFATFTPLLVCMGWVAIAALVTRVVRHDSHVTQHWSVVVLFMSGLLLSSYLDEVVRFNLGDGWLSQGIQTGIFGCLLVALFWLQMKIAFRQRAWVRTLLANTLGWGFIGYLLLGANQFKSDFEPVPDFEALLLPEAVRFVPSTSEAAFLKASDELYEFTEEELAVD